MITIGNNTKIKNSIIGKDIKKEKELQERINKAIKFIKTHDLYHPTNEVILLSILKGSDKE